MKHSPELRQTRVLLPERFTASLFAPSALQAKVVSPLVVIRIYKIYEIGHTKTNSKDFALLTIFQTFKATYILHENMPLSNKFLGYVKVHC